MTTFKEMGLHKDILKSLDDLGFEQPSPIQNKTIPYLLKSKNDLIALAQTGTGKTAAFSLPILNQLTQKSKDLEALIICPTRELCLQISDDIKKFTKHTKGINTTAVYGGERIDLQIKALRRNVNIVVGTPGRLHDMIRRNKINLENIRWVVLDEADEMLDMGFKEDLDAILIETSETRQTLLFSATMSKSVRSIAKCYMKNAEEISVGTENSGADKVSHEYYVASARDRFEVLKRLLDNLPEIYGILFCRTRMETQMVAEKLNQANYKAEALHGDISQAMRTKIMDKFRKKQIHLLVATDVAARGIDVSDLTHVINYNLPDQNETYTHRSGRTGRAQKSGVAISIVSPRETGRIRRLESSIGKTFERKNIPSGKEVCQKQVDCFNLDIEKDIPQNLDDDASFQAFSKKMNKLTKTDLIKYMYNEKFGRFLRDHANARDFNVAEKQIRERPDSNNVNLKISIGKKHGFDIKGLFSLINAQRSLKQIEIGRINLMPNFTIFAVEKDQAEKVIKFVTGTNFKGQTINVTRDRGGFARNDRRKKGSFRDKRSKRRR